MWIEYNINPFGLHVGDCVVRAVAKALGISWGDAYIDLCFQGYIMGDIASSNAVWSAYLRKKGFNRMTICDCPEIYTVERFCEDHPDGTYVVGTGSHAVAVEDGCYYDAWDSGQESAVYYFEKTKKET